MSALSNLLVSVYSFIYKVKPDSVDFTLTPMPRLEVETIQDFKVLFEIGALTPDMSLELSRIMLGSAARPRKKDGERVGGDAVKSPGALLESSNGNLGGSSKGKADGMGK